LQKKGQGKDFEIHGKSSTTHPIDGLVPFDSRISKLSYKDPGKIQYYQGENDESFVRGIDKFEDYLNEFSKIVQRQNFSEDNLNNKDTFIAELRAAGKDNVLKDLFRLYDIEKEMETKGVVSKEVYQKNGSDIFFLTDDKDEVLYDSNNHAILVSKEEEGRSRSGSSSS
jgi:hypothetical protein